MVSFSFVCGMCGLFREPGACQAVQQYLLLNAHIDNPCHSTTYHAPLPLYHTLQQPSACAHPLSRCALDLGVQHSQRRCQPRLSPFQLTARLTRVTPPFNYTRAMSSSSSTNNCAAAADAPSSVAATDVRALADALRSDPLPSPQQLEQLKKGAPIAHSTLSTTPSAAGVRKGLPGLHPRRGARGGSGGQGGSGASTISAATAPPTLAAAGGGRGVGRAGGGPHTASSCDGTAVSAAADVPREQQPACAPPLASRDAAGVRSFRIAAESPTAQDEGSDSWESASTGEVRLWGCVLDARVSLDTLQAPTTLC